MEIKEIVTLIVSIFLLAICAIYFSIFIHEFGHLVCGTLSGYKFSSFSFLGFTLSKQNGGLKLQKNKLARGMGGQCLMIPPNYSENWPFKLYNAGGVIANFFVVVLSIILLVFVKKWILAFQIFFLISLCINFLAIFANGIPMAGMGLPNDAKNIQIVSESSDAKKSFYTGFYLDTKRKSGFKISEIEFEKLILSDDSDFTNLYVGYIKWQQCIWYADKGDISTALTLMQSFEPYLDFYNNYGYYKNDYISNIIFYYSLYGFDSEHVDKLRSKEYLTFTKKVKTPSFHLSESAYSFMIAKDMFETKKHLEAYQKTLKNENTIGVKRFLEDQSLLLKNAIRKNDEHFQ